MKNIIVGTAGHIDHGKTSLVKALTGIDADRLAEEKRRGITIDLGFAHLQLTPEIRVGFVDVPGHERFVRNMLAGVGGIDVVLFVVSAEESIKPQTREHFEICRLLGIREGIVALTKADLVPQDLIDLVKLEMEEFVAGSFLESAPLIPVSSVTGAGLPGLRAAIQAAAARVPPKDVDGPARLPIDRAFTMKGFGTVVTGTLLSGSIAREEELELMPLKRRLRVRGMQMYGKTADRALAGTRAAINLADIEPAEVHRGMVLAESDRFETTRVIDCSLELLKSARPLKHRAPVHFHSGTAEMEAEVRLFGKTVLDPGQTAFVRLRLKEPAVLAAGDRFILRQFSPVVTIAGGSVIDVRPTRERAVARIAARLAVLAGDDAAAKVSLLIEESPFGLSPQELSLRLAIQPAQALTLARQAKALVVDVPGWAVSQAWAKQTRAALTEAVKTYHAAQPLSPGFPRSDLKAQTLSAAPGFLFDVLLAGIPDLIAEADRIRHRSHRVELSGEEQTARRNIEMEFANAGLAVPVVPEVLARAGVDPARGRAILQMLLKDRVLIRVNDDLLLHQSAVSALKTMLAPRKNQTFTVPMFKDWTGVSRKYAVPILEFLDREKCTIRQGDSRRIL